MSAPEHELVEQIPAGILSSNTVAQSILSEQRDRRLEPEDLRTRRFGYNPGFKLVMDPVWSGLQTQEIPSGCLILFETATVSRRNLSVDKDDKSPPNVFGDFLAGEGLRSVYQQCSGMGFREILPLRGLSNPHAAKLFSVAHPRLRDCYEQGIIEPCIYGLKECECQERGVCDYCTYTCVTCRSNVLQALSIPEAAKPTFEVVKESVAVCKAAMTDIWNTVVGEVAAAQTPGTNSRGVLASITEGHMFIMRHLHQRTPGELELAKISANAKVQAEVMQSSMAQLAQTLNVPRTEDPGMEVMRRQMAAMQERIAQMAAPKIEEKKDE